MPKLTVNQLKRLVREAIDEIDPMDLERQAKGVEKMSNKDELLGLYSDMYKELYNIRPRWLKRDVSEEQLRDMIAHLEEIYPREMERRKQEEEKEIEYFEQMIKKHEEEAREKAELGVVGDDEEALPMRSGMGRRLSESLKTIVRETYEASCMETEENLEKEAVEEYLSEKKSMRLGQGGRFEKLTDKLKSQGKSEESAKAIAASIGRKKYGKVKMAQWAKAGKKRASKE
jgi:hypothetical protein